MASDRAFVRAAIAALVLGMVAHASAQPTGARPRNGRIVGWGSSVYGGVLANIPEGTDFVEVTAGYGFAIARRADGTVVPWGRTTYRLNQGPKVGPGVRFRQVSAGYDHGAALTTDGQLVTWGHNTTASGGCTTCGNDPPPPNGHTYTKVSAGENYSMALRDDGRIILWGTDHFHVSTAPEPVPGDPFVEIVAGAHFGLALRQSGELLVLGGDLHTGECHNPPSMNGPHIMPPMMGWPVLEIGTGHCSAYAIAPDASTGQIKAWAWGGFTFCGNLDIPPEEVTSLVRITGGYGHGMGQRPDGTLAVWGGCMLLSPDITDFPYQGQRFISFARGHCNMYGLGIIPPGR